MTNEDNQNENKKRGEGKGKREREREGGGKGGRRIQLSSFNQFLRCILRLPHFMHLLRVQLSLGSAYNKMFRNAH